VILYTKVNGYFTIITDNLDSLNTATPLQIVFSEAIDSMSMSISDVSVFDSVSSAFVLISKRIKKLGTVMEIMPFGSWAVSKEYTLTISNLKSITGAALFDMPFTKKFRVVKTGIPGDIKNLRFAGLVDTIKTDFNTASIELFWSTLQNADYYNIYKRMSNDSNWQLIQTTQDSSVQISVLEAMSNGLTTKFMVLGSNKFGNSNPETAATVTVKDETKPSYSSTMRALSNWYDFSNYYGSVPSKTSINVFFREPMDTSGTPAITVKNGNSQITGDNNYVLPVRAISWSWVSSTNAKLTAVIPAPQDASNDTITINCSTLKDLAGNVFSTDTINSLAAVIRFITMQ
jgi:hypothetical protein